MFMGFHLLYSCCDRLEDGLMRVVGIMGLVGFIVVHSVLGL